MNNNVNNINKSFSNANGKIPDGVKKRLLLSGTNYNIALTGGNTVCYVGSYAGYINLGPLEPVDNDPSSQMFVNSQTVMINQQALPGFINDCLRAYKMLVSKDYEPFTNVLTSNQNQRLISSFESYQNSYIYQIRIQFCKRTDENSKENSYLENDEENWIFTQKGVVFSFEKLHTLLSHFDFIIMSTLPQNDSGQRYMAELYEACQESNANSPILEDFFKNLDMTEINTLSYIARRKKIKELVSNYGKYYLAVKRKPLQEFTRSKIVHNLMYKFQIVCCLLSVLKNFFFKYIAPAETFSGGNVGQMAIAMNNNG